MDSDDVSMPLRLEKQVNFLEANKDFAAAAGFIRFIDEQGRSKGVWPLDRKTVSSSDIFRITPRESCIAHPSVMFRTSIIKSFPYREYQKHIEDYDLWMLLLSLGYKFGKVPDEVLLYRIHAQSVTRTANNALSPTKRVLDCKRRFLIVEVIKNKRLNGFLCRVAFYMMIDFLTLQFKRGKQIVSSR
jgi:hypothetical protein